MGWRIESGAPIGDWVARRLGCAFHSDDRAMGLVKDGVIGAGVITERWNGRSLVMHIVIERCITRSYIRAVFDYCFNVCGVGKIIAPVESVNEKCKKFVKNMGFVEEAKIADANPTGDIVFYTLKRSDCRFLGDRRYG